MKETMGSSSAYTAPFMMTVRRPMETKEINMDCRILEKFFFPKHREKYTLLPMERPMRMDVRKIMRV